MSGRSELFRFLLVGTLAATEAGCVPEQKSPEDQQALGPDVISTSPLEKSILTFTPTATLARAQTETQTPVPEPVPTTCLDPEVNNQVVDEFLQDFGSSSLETSLGNPKEYFTGHAGFENGPSWYRIFDLMLLGGYKFSLAEEPGFGRDDSAYCILGASPHLGETVVPIIIGVERDGQWSQVTYFFKNSLVGVPPKAILFSAEDANRWIKESRGKKIHALIVTRYSQPGWERDPLWHVGYDEVLPLLQNPKGYILKYTSIQTEIAPSASFPNGMPGLRTLIQDLNLQPGGDIGLFSFQITVED